MMDYRPCAEFSKKKYAVPVPNDRKALGLPVLDQRRYFHLHIKKNITPKQLSTNRNQLHAQKKREPEGPLFCKHGVV
jgi:hypothetical protein